MNKLKQAIEDSCPCSCNRCCIGLVQHKLLEVLVEELEGEKFADSSQGGQFGLHIDGYNQAIEDIIALIKEAKV